MARERNKLLGELAGVIGNDAALALIDALGGRRVLIPAKPTALSRLVGVIGADALAKLSAEYAGMALKLPVAKGWRARMHRLRGRSVEEIAKLVGMSVGGVEAALERGGPQFRKLGAKRSAAHQQRRDIHRRLRLVVRSPNLARRVAQEAATATEPSKTEP